MTWYSTWPEGGVPAYEEHATEAEALAHAKWVIDSNTARYATAYEIDQELP